MTSSDPPRARVVIIDNGNVALIKRVRDGMTYYLFPGGGVEEGETPEEAAVREAREELGVDVRLGELVHEEVFKNVRFLYFRADIAGGEFGTGKWPDHEHRDAAAREKSGTHDAVWLPLEELRNTQIGVDVRPRELVERLLH